MGSGFSNGQWLCCSRFAPSAHLSPENLLTCHAYYHMVLTALAEGLDASAAERIFGYRQATITTWLTRAGQHAQSLHEHVFCHLQLPYVQLDELRTRLRSHTHVLWLWLAIDPMTKILPVLHLGLRTQNAAHSVIHSLRQILAPGCVPLFTSDGLNLYFYALTAHFGYWLQVVCRGRNVRQWQVAEELIYGQVKKSYQRRKLARVTPVMRLGTEADLTSVLQGLGLSGRLNTAFIERVNLTVRHGIAAFAVPGLRPSKAHTCSPIWSGGARAATSTRGQPSGSTVPAADASDGSRKNEATMDSSRGALLPIAKGLRLRVPQARGGCRVIA